MTAEQKTYCESFLVEQIDARNRSIAGFEKHKSVADEDCQTYIATLRQEATALGAMLDLVTHYQVLPK